MKRVLLIDDDPITNYINKRVIEIAGLAGEIVLAENGQQGLEILIEGNDKGDPFPDLIVLDINMPVVNGFEFLNQLQDLAIPGCALKNITIVSSSDRNEDKVKAKELGIENYLVKPMTTAVLKRLLE